MNAITRKGRTFFLYDLHYDAVNIWQGKVSVNKKTGFYNQSINQSILRLHFHFLALHVSVLVGPSLGFIMIVRLTY
jgi:hypothetical protein